MFGLLRGALTLLYYRVFQYNRVSALHDVAIVDESGRAICSNSKRQVVSSITQKYGQPLIHRWWISSWPTFTQQGQTHFVVVCRRKKKGKHLKSKKYISKREKKVENVKRLFLVENNSRTSTSFRIFDRNLRDITVHNRKTYLRASSEGSPLYQFTTIVNYHVGLSKL